MLRHCSTIGVVPSPRETIGRPRVIGAPHHGFCRRRPFERIEVNMSASDHGVPSRAERRLTLDARPYRIAAPTASCEV